MSIPPLQIPDQTDVLSKLSSVHLSKVSVPNNEGIAQTPTVFTFEFSEDIGLSASVTYVTFWINEHKIIQTQRTITKPLKPVAGDLLKATAQLIFPEALAGARLTITYSILSLLVKTSIIQTAIDIKRAGNQPAEIEKAYWAEQEHAMWGATLTKRKEICRNETGFLHIYTKGMFGQEVYLKYQGNGGSMQVLGTNSKAIIRDNVVSVPYPMSKALSGYKAAVPAFSGDSIKVYAFIGKTAAISDFKNTEELILWCKQDATNPTSATTVPPVKVIIETEEEETENTGAEAILEFRPDASYTGDYGFDWVRRQDTGAPGHHHDHDFKTHMGKHYYTATMKVENDGNKHGDAFKKDENSNQAPSPKIVLDYDTGIPDTTFGEGKMYRRLRLRYRRLLFNWNFDTNATAHYEAHTPIMTIMKGKTANLDLLVHVKTVPEKIVFEFSNTKAEAALQIKTPATKEITALAKGYQKLSLTIECTDEFDDEYTLFARTFAAGDPKGQICGMLRILPNGQMYQHKIKLVLFSVITNLTGNPSPNKGNILAEKKRLSQILGQALVTADIEGAELDTTTDATFRTDFCESTGVGNNPKYVISNDKIKTKKLKEYLESKRSSTYDFYYKIYVFDEEHKTSNGYSYGEKFTCLFNTANKETGVHELLHSLELAHPFDAYSRNTPFTYEYQKTDNIMDYGHGISGLTRKSLFYWQWKILNVKLK